MPVAPDPDPAAWPPVRLPVVALALAAGVAGTAYTGPLATAPVVWASATALLLLLTRWRRARLRAAAVLAIAALVGATLAARERGATPRLPAGVVAGDREPDAITGVIAGPMLAAPGRVGFVVDADAPADLRVLVTIEPELAGKLLPGDRVTVRGKLRVPRGYRNPGAVDRAQIVHDRGGQAEVTAQSITVVARDASLTPWRAATRAHRAAIAAVVERGGDPAGSAIVRAAVIGDRGAVPEATDQAWRAAGIYHALSVSGLHLAVVALLLFGVVRRGWAAVPGLAMRIDPARLAAAVSAPAAIAYTLVTGGQTATLRALVVVLAVLGGVVLRRRLVVLDAIGLAALAILLQRPSALLDPSFQLSFVAAITVCLVARRADDGLEVAPASRLGRAARAIGRWVVSGVKVSMWVTASTAPITAWHFHQVAIGGVVGNLVLGPGVELVVIPAGLLGLLVSALGGPGGALIDLAIAAAALIDRGAAVLAGWVPVLEVPPPRPLELVAWLVMLAGVGVAWRAPARRRRGVVVALAAAALVAASLTWTIAIEPGVRDQLRITFLDVGQGDAAVIELPGGAVWLIDAGGLPVMPSEAIAADHAARLQRGPGEAIRRFLRHRRIGRIDVAVISHPHPDHYLGLLALAGEVPIGELWIARPPPDQAYAHPDGAMPSFEQVAAVLVAHGTRVVYPPLGEARRDHGVGLEVLGPIYDDGTGAAPVAAADPVRSVNDDSLVVAVTFAGRRALFLGDVEGEGEDLLVAAGVAGAEVVKVAHHGSPTSSSAALVAATGARWAVVSCGRGNRFGFPAADVASRWESAGATVLRTDQVGAITVTIDPDGSVEVRGVD